MALLAIGLALAATGCRRRADDVAHASQSADPLSALPYLSSNPMSRSDERRAGVTQHDRARTWAGLNIYASRIGTGAVLMDMQGEVVHRWQSEQIPGNWTIVKFDAKSRALYVIAGDRALYRVDWQSGATALLSGRYIHHDVAPVDNGDVWCLTGAVREVQAKGANFSVPILDDVLTRLSSRGHIKQTVSLWDLFGDRVPLKRLTRIYDARRKQPDKRLVIWGQGPESADNLLVGAGSPFDVFHTNTIEVVTREVPDVARPGDLLISLRELDLVAVVDPEAGKVRWSWGPGEIDAQHQPTFLENGGMLVFDNGVARRRSRVLEVVPQTGAIAWQYDPSGGEPFYSPTMAGAQRLPNGNTLITESRRGRVFEVTPTGEVVWEWFNPDMVDKKGNRERVALFRMMRVPPSVLP